MWLAHWTFPSSLELFFSVSDSESGVPLLEATRFCAPPPKHKVKETQSCGLQSPFPILTFVYAQAEENGLNCQPRVPAVGSPLKTPHNPYFGFRSESRATLRPSPFPVVLKYKRGGQAK